MKKYSLENILHITKTRKADFDNILSVLHKKAPARSTLFEFFLNGPLEQKLAQWKGAPKTEEETMHCKIKAFANAGYDYTTVLASDFRFKHKNNRHGKASISANEGFEIFDRPSYAAYNWEDPREFYTNRLERIEKYLPSGMKFIVHGPSGVLENTISLVGFDNLCYLLADDPELIEMVVDQIGQRLLDYYEQIIHYDCVGAIISNDDWGFNTQTMLSTEDMKKYIFKWHKKITRLAHSAGKPVILHSCGNLEKVWDDIIYDMQYDAKHSYEDNIMPVERVYDELKGKIAVLGGIDVDFVCRAPNEDVFQRCSAILEKTGCKGYALGTGNSIPTYLPDEKYFAMISAALI
ncbi:MAG: hypothetical protein M0R40_01820 [Firmicutes bacterium]|nr:hypothetical protein [Bacillota bacterium]